MRKQKIQKELLDYFTNEQIDILIQTKAILPILKTGEWYTNNIELLSKKVFKNEKILAQLIIEYNNKWLPQDEHILKLIGNSEATVAYELAWRNNEWITYKRSILISSAKYNTTPIAWYLAKKSNWITFDKKILSLDDINVAKNLALFNPKWCCYNIDILKNVNVYDALMKKKKYIATKIKNNAITVIPII